MKLDKKIIKSLKILQKRSRKYENKLRKATKPRKVNKLHSAIDEIEQGINRILDIWNEARKNIDD